MLLVSPKQKLQILMRATPSKHSRLCFWACAITTGLFVDQSVNYNILEKTSNEAFQALWVEISFVNHKNIHGKKPLTYQ